MKKDGMTSLTSGVSQFGSLKAKPIKSTTTNRGITRQKGIAKRSMSFSYKK